MTLIEANVIAEPYNCEIVQVDAHFEIADYIHETHPKIQEIGFTRKHFDTLDAAIKDLRESWQF